MAIFDLKWQLFCSGVHFILNLPLSSKLLGIKRTWFIIWCYPNRITNWLGYIGYVKLSSLSKQCFGYGPAYRSYNMHGQRICNMWCKMKIVCYPTFKNARITVLYSYAIFILFTVILPVTKGNAPKYDRLWLLDACKNVIGTFAGFVYDMFTNALMNVHE